MNEYIDYLHEVFEWFGPVTTRKMFGGHGIYHNGLMFALVADGVLYLKTDGENSDHFVQEGLPPFEFIKKGKLIKTSYYRAPDEIMDDRELAAVWARRSYAAAVRAHK